MTTRRRSPRKGRAKRSRGMTKAKSQTRAEIDKAAAHQAFVDGVCANIPVMRERLEKLFQAREEKP